MKVLILDDETKRATDWQTALSELGLTAVVPQQEEVVAIIRKLQEHRLAARGGSFMDFRLLDETDLLIVDYDLLGLEGEGWTTGAEVAYAARLLSRVKTIVVVNQYGTNSFDLTMRRTIFSHADVDVGSAQITNAGLYSAKDFSGFRPWHWPDLCSESKRHQAFVDFVLDHLDDAISDQFGFDLENPESSRYLSKETCGAISLNESVTFRELAKANRSGGLFSVLEKDAPILGVCPEDIIASLAASVLSRWVDRFVLPNQDVFIDFPHAVSSVPWIMSGHAAIEDWNSFGLTHAPAFAVDLSDQTVKHSFLASRAIYWREDVFKLPRPEGFSMSSVPDFVFCEDSSRFVPVDDAMEFTANLESYMNRRWVCRVDRDVIYEPQAYLLE